MIYKKKVKCSKESLKSIRDFVAKALVSLGRLTESESNLIVLAVDEVCSNIIIHSNLCNPEESIEIRMISKSGEELVFEIHDHGQSFNITDYSVPPIEQIIRTKRLGGIGLILVKKIMDQVSMEKKGQKNIYRLYKSISPSSNYHSA